MPLLHKPQTNQFNNLTQNQFLETQTKNYTTTFFFDSFQFEYRYMFLTKPTEQEKIKSSFLHITDHFAPNYSRLQYNRAGTFLQYIIIDCDTNEYINILKDKDIPQPNYVIQNKKKAGGHLFFILDRPILKNKSYQHFADRFFHIFKELTEVFKGDNKHNCYIGKNYLNTYDYNGYMLNYDMFSLNDLEKYIKPKIHTPQNNKSYKNIKSFTKTDLTEVFIGERNSCFFNELRQYGYLWASSKNLKELLTEQGEQINNLFPDPLEKAEVKATVNSIYKYCRKHKDKILSFKKKEKLKVMKLDNSIPIKTKQQLSAERTNKIRSAKAKISIETAIKQLKIEGKKTNIANIVRITKITKKTVSKYLKELL